MKWAEPHLANRRELLEAVKSGRFFYRQKVTSKRKGRIVVGKGAFGRRQGSYQAGYLTVVISKVQVGLATFLGGAGFPFRLSWAVLGATCLLLGLFLYHSFSGAVQSVTCSAVSNPGHCDHLHPITTQSGAEAPGDIKLGLCSSSCWSSSETEV